MQLIQNTRFKHIVSLGFFCNIALELEKRGRRDGSYPFDWVITDINSVTQLIKNGFQNLFEKDLLFRNTQYQYIVQHKNYKFDFYHDFIQEVPIEQQIEKISIKYKKRIEKFYNNIKCPTLFIRYIENEEVEYWYKEAEELVSFLKSYNEDNTIILIVNEEVSLNVSRIIEGVSKVFFIERDYNDVVARRILKDSKPIRDFILQINYPLHVKLNNYFIYYRKTIKKYLLKKIFLIMKMKSVKH